MKKIFATALFFFLTSPSLVSAQSLEWVAEHQGAVTPALVAASGTSVATPTPPIAPNTNDGLEAKVRAYFSDIPVMAAIAQCESRFRQFDSNGNALDGGAGGMIGLFQIFASVHANYAKSLGMDIYTIDGNLAYARKLYDQDGTDPWLDSFSCWHPLMQAQVAAPGKTTLTQDLVLGTISPEVKALQVLLNGHGYMLASDGPGSPGQETTKFGALTRNALRKFQCEKMQVCTGDEGTSGYGMVGSATRNALLALGGDTPVAATSDTPVPQASGTDESAQIAALQKQIADLTAILTSLKNKSA